VQGSMKPPYFRDEELKVEFPSFFSDQSESQGRDSF
jgi:hypothetical protein